MKIMLLGAAISNHTLRWVNGLSDKGHDVLLVCRGDQKAKDENITISSKVDVHYLRFGGGVGYYLNVFELKRVYKNFKPDIVHAHYATGYGTLARLAGCRPLVLSFWGSDIFEFPYKSDASKKMLYQNMIYADAIASTSHAMAKKIKEVYPEYEKEITVTPFGIDTQLFKPMKESSNIRPIIGIVKYLKPIYDIPLLIKAFALVKEKSEHKPLLHIYGGGPLQKDLETMCADLGIWEDVTFWGTIPNTEIVYAINSMDVFVNCSITESFGVALLEAMACEVPVVATDTVGYREVVEDNVTGFILKDREPITMAKAIIELLNKPVLRKTLGRNGRERVKRLYNWENDLLIMEQLYKGVLKNYRKENN